MMDVKRSILVKLGAHVLIVLNLMLDKSLLRCLADWTHFRLALFVLKNFSEIKLKFGLNLVYCSNQANNNQKCSNNAHLSSWAESSFCCIAANIFAFYSPTSNCARSRLWNWISRVADDFAFLARFNSRIWFSAGNCFFYDF